MHHAIMQHMQQETAGTIQKGCGKIKDGKLGMVIVSYMCWFVLNIIFCMYSIMTRFIVENLKIKSHVIMPDINISAI